MEWRVQGVVTSVVVAAGQPRAHQKGGDVVDADESR